MADDRRTTEVWFRLDAGFLFDDKTVDLGEEHGAAGPLVYVALLGAAKLQDDDGLVRMGWRQLARHAFIDDLDKARAIVATMVDCGALADLDDAGRTFAARIVNWEHKQVSKGAKRTRLYRQRRASHGVTEASQERHSDAPVTPSDADPSPERPSRAPETGTGTTTEESKLSSSVTEWPADVERLCSLLASLATVNGARNAKVTDTWRVECRRLIERDGRSAEDVEETIRWSQADDFWRSNILSMPKLRQQFDRLWLRMHPPATPGRTVSPGQDAPNPKWWAGALEAEHAKAQS